MVTSVVSPSPTRRKRAARNTSAIAALTPAAYAARFRRPPPEPFSSPTDAFAITSCAAVTRTWAASTTPPKPRGEEYSSSSGRAPLANANAPSATATSGAASSAGARLPRTTRSMGRITSGTRCLATKIVLCDACRLASMRVHSAALNASASGNSRHAPTHTSRGPTREASASARDVEAACAASSGVTLGRNVTTCAFRSDTETLSAQYAAADMMPRRVTASSLLFARAGVLCGSGRLDRSENPIDPVPPQWSVAFLVRRLHSPTVRYTQKPDGTRATHTSPRAGSEPKRRACLRARVRCVSARAPFAPRVFRGDAPRTPVARCGGHLGPPRGKQRPLTC